MGKRGDGYGSEHHLRSYLDSRPEKITDAVASVLDVEPSSVHWLPFLPHAAGDREYRALEFLPPETLRELRPAWNEFWPQRGHQQSWDAVGSADGDWLLVEAKSNWPEFCTPPTTAKGD